MNFCIICFTGHRGTEGTSVLLKIVFTLQSQSDCSVKRKTMKSLQFFSVLYLWKDLYAFDLFVRALDLGAVMKWQKLYWLVVIYKNLYLSVSVLVKNWLIIKYFNNESSPNVPEVCIFWDTPSKGCCFRWLQMQQNYLVHFAFELGSLWCMDRIRKCRNRDQYSVFSPKARHAWKS